jgi:GGDEF domain-containing protein
MSHFLTVPINENGIILDERFREELQTAATDPFAFTDIFLYSHGWWNTASSASAEYNIFSLGFAKALQGLVCSSPAQWPKIGAAFQPLALAIHWPSMLSREQASVANFLEATSFFTMQQRADSVGRHAGYCLLRLMIERQKDGHPYRFNLIGHSFGCRVLCAALQALAEDAETCARMSGNEFNVALIQAAADTDSLAPGQLYGKVQQCIPNLRMLVTTSANDTALGKWYPEAQRIAHLFSGPVAAMGSKGPTGNLTIPVDQRFDVTRAIVPTFTERMGVANLTPLHQTTADAYGATDNWGGQHSDINRPQIYDMLARFFGK